MESMMMPTVLIFGQNTKRDGSAVRVRNISTAEAFAELLRTNLGPAAMYKLLMDPMGGVVMTNDGNAILREIIVQHPVGKMIVEIARTQDEEVGDGTTSVVILCGQILYEVKKHLDSSHPVVIIRELRRALDDIINLLPQMSKNIDLNNKNEVLSIAKTCLGTKFLSHSWSNMLCELAIKAVDIVRESQKGKQRIDITSFVRIEKLPGGVLDDTELVEGVVINKDVLHPDMKRLILNPRILLLCTGLEYRKGESVTNIEFTNEQGYTKMLQIEEEYIENLCKTIILHKPDLVITEKGASDLAIHYLAKAGITLLRRVKKMDIIRLSKVCNATIIGRVEEINAKHIGVKAGKFEVKLIGDDYFSFISDCTDIKACTLFLRGPSKDILHEVERNLQDVMNIVRNIYYEPRVVPGGGTIEMQLYTKLMSACEGYDSLHSPYSCVLKALKVIPRTLLYNTGSSPLRGMNELESKHNQGEVVGVDGLTGDLLPLEKLGVWESTRVKGQIYKTAVETAVQILKIDEIVSGTKSKQREEQLVSQKGKAGKPTTAEEKGQGDNNK